MRRVDQLIPIGQFSALTWLSPKALRIYHEQQLLEPAFVDPQSGYRYYAPEQISVAARIGLLRRAGIGLADITQFLRAPSRDRVATWRTALDAEHAERARLLDHVSRLTDLQEVTTMSTTNAPTLQRAIPVLASLDLETTQQFWAGRLGFDPLFAYPDYAISARDGVQVHFWLTDDAAIPHATSCRIDVSGIEALYVELRDAGVVHPNGPLREQPWGIKEFAVLDGDGNLVKFAESVRSA
jgi:DNA-binding transcriptional MerR regulator